MNWVEKNNELIDSFQTSYKLTKDDVKTMGRGRVGDTIPVNPPIPEDPGQALVLFKSYYAQSFVYINEGLFLEKYRTWSKAAIESELKELEDWRNSTLSLSYSKLLEARHLEFHDEWRLEFLKIRNGYYDNHAMTNLQCAPNTTASFVYGKYELWFNELNKKLADASNEDLMQAARDSLSKEVIGSFFFLIRNSNLLPQSYNETHQAYCKRACKLFMFTWTDTPRRHFATPRPSVLNQIKLELLPVIDPELRSQIEQYVTETE